MKEIPSIYNEHGQIKNEDIARHLAETEDPHRKKKYKIFSAPKKQVEEGIAKAGKLEELYEDLENLDFELKTTNHDNNNRWIENIKLSGDLNGHKIEFEFTPLAADTDSFKYSPELPTAHIYKLASKLTVDGEEYSAEDSGNFYIKYKNILQRKIEDISKVENEKDRNQDNMSRDYSKKKIDALTLKNNDEIDRPELLEETDYNKYIEVKNKLEKPADNLSQEDIKL